MEMRNGTDKLHRHYGARLPLRPTWTIRLVNGLMQWLIMGHRRLDGWLWGIEIRRRRGK